MFPLCNSEMGLGVHQIGPIQTWHRHQRPREAAAWQHRRGDWSLKCPGTRPVSLGSETAKTPVGARTSTRGGAGAEGAARCARGSERLAGARGRGRARARARRGCPGWSARCASRRASGWRVGAWPRSPVRVAPRSPGRALLPGECGLLYPGQGEREGVLAADPSPLTTVNPVACGADRWQSGFGWGPKGKGDPFPSEPAACVSRGSLPVRSWQDSPL